MKKRLSSIVREYKFDSVQDFYKELNAAEKENRDYKSARAKYEKFYGEKTVDSMRIRDKLRQKEQIVREREAGGIIRQGIKIKGQGSKEWVEILFENVVINGQKDYIVWVWLCPLIFHLSKVLSISSRLD